MKWRLQISKSCSRLGLTPLMSLVGSVCTTWVCLHSRLLSALMTVTRNWNRVHCSLRGAFLMMQPDCIHNGSIKLSTRHEYSQNYRKFFASLLRRCRDCRQTQQHTKSPRLCWALNFSCKILFSTCPFARPAPFVLLSGCLIQFPFRNI